MEKEDIMGFLVQLTEALRDGEAKLEFFYKNRDYQKFHKTKEFILQIQKKISEVLR